MFDVVIKAYPSFDFIVNLHLLIVKNQFVVFYDIVNTVRSQ